MVAPIACGREQGPVFSEYLMHTSWGFPGSSAVENPPASADVGLIPGSQRSPGRWHGHPVQNSCLGNPTDRGASQAAVHGFTKSWT